MRRLPFAGAFVIANVIQLGAAVVVGTALCFVLAAMIAALDHATSHQLPLAAAKVETVRAALARLSET